MLMKKTFPFLTQMLLLIVFSLTPLAAQNLSVIDYDEYIVGTPDDIMTIHAKVVNNSFLEAIDVKMKVNVHEIQPGQSMLICWGTTCFPPVDSVGESSWDDYIYTIDANSNSGNVFKTDIEQGGVLGKIHVTFTFFNANNPSDQASFTAVADVVATDIQETSSMQIEIFPNPASDFINLKLEEVNINGKINILDMNGKLMKSVDVQSASETYKLDIGILPSGIYLLSFTDLNGNQISRKFSIVR